jgi:small subunit ribosomal protein S4e
MHQTRSKVTTKIPIERKTTKYVARSLGSLENSVPVVIAIRDMLHLARTKKEVEDMVHKKLLKVNGREVKDSREPIYLFNILEADKHYVLSLTHNNRFSLNETKNANQRICKIIGKKLLKEKKIQFNLHDGTNTLSKEKFAIGDSICFDLSGKVVKHLPLEKGKECFVVSGKYAGSTAKIESIEKNLVKIKIKEGDITASINKSHLMVI